MLILLPVIGAAIYLILPKFENNAALLAPSATETNGNSAAMPNAERMLFLLQYIGVDYGGAVHAGKVIDEYEYREMNEFCQTVLAGYQHMPKAAETTTVLEWLAELQRLVTARADWAEVRAVTHGLIPLMSKQLNVIPYPLKRPELANGKKLYADYCSDCHGVSGDGRGPSSADLKPPPSNFNNAERMLHLTPFQFYNAMTFGVEGTAMGSFSDLLTPQERWEIAFHLMTIKPTIVSERPSPKESFGLRELATESNAVLARRLAQQRVPGYETSSIADSILTAALDDVDYLRRQQPHATPLESLAFARTQFEKSLQAYQAGEMQNAGAFAVDAYLHGIENIEIELKSIDAGLENRLEKSCADYRSCIADRTSMAQVYSCYKELMVTLDEVAVALSDKLKMSQLERGAAGFGFVQAFTIILREGIEAALLLGLMIAYLTAAGYESLRRHVVLGGVAGLIFGVITWTAAQTLITVSPLQREALEGLTSLLAAAVLFSISLWIIHNADVQRWKTYIQTRAETAISTGSKFTLISAAFLAVYREAFETVLFYQVLWMRTPLGHTGVIFGFIIGSVALAGIMIAIFKFGMRIPLKPFFVATGVMLSTLVFVFVGYGIRELQNIGWLKETPLAWDFRVPLLEIHPTVEGVAFQIAIVASFVLGWMFTVFAQERKARPAMEAL